MQKLISERSHAVMNDDELIHLQSLEDEIHQKIQEIKKQIHDEDRWVAQEIAMKKQSSSELIYPKYDKKTCYYQEFWKVYLFNEIMISKIKDYSVCNKDLAVQIDALDEAEKQWAAIWALKSKKKVRRTSDMLEKVFDCPFDKCGKNYGSDVSLNLHMKLKHHSGTKTERQTLAREVCLAEERGEKINVNLIFPPGYLKRFRQDYRKDLH